MGYLRYNESNQTVTIPNQEIADVFGDAAEGEGWNEIETGNIAIYNSDL